MAPAFVDAPRRYKEKNKDEPGTAEKIKDLSDFVKSSKFGMMTTKAPSSDDLVSRAMAVAAQVSTTPPSTLPATPPPLTPPKRKPTAST